MLDKFLPRTTFGSYEDFKINYKVSVPDNFNFGFDVVDAWASEQPDKRALVWCNDQGEEHFFSFSDIKSESNRIANFLTGLGITKGSTVMLILKRRYEYWMVAVALHKIGAVLIPASIQLTPKDIEYRNNAASVDMIISVNEAEIVDHITAALPKSPTVKHLALVGDQERDGFINLNKEATACSDIFDRPIGEAANKITDRMVMFFTSGTTGMPKMVLHDFSYPLGHIVTAKYWQKAQDNGLHFTISDSGWAKFSWGKIYGQWICGSAIFAYDMDKFVPHNVLTAMERYKPTTFCAPPTMYRFFIKEDLTKYDWSYVNHCCTAGEPLNPEVFNQFKKATGHRIVEGFGQTESSVLLANFDGFDAKPGSTGKPSPLYDLAILDDDGNECQEGEEGEIVIRNVLTNPPTGLFKEYYMDPEANAKAFREGNYHTGDVAWFDADGYYWFVGRKDDVIKCSGYRIGPFEVESALMEHPSVLECAITAAPDPIRGQVVKATIVLARGYTASDELAKELQDHVKRVTAPYKYPRIVEFVAELPKTTSGKIKRGQIRSMSK
jgi:acetyl-CoA synthetase